MCKYNNKCSGSCKGGCRTKVQQINKVVVFDSTNIPQGPEGPALVPQETDDVFTQVI